MPIISPITKAEQEWIDRTRDIAQVMHRVYGLRFREYMAESNGQRPIYNMGKAANIYWQRRWQHMLNFKNAAGEIVMTEKDNGKLAIHDNALKQSLEHKVSLEEARTAQADRAENGQ